MPITSPAVSGLVAASLASVGNTGIAAPLLAAGVGNGVSTWTPQIVVMTVDVGSAGAGSGGPIPVVVPGSLVGTMTGSFVSFGIKGIAAPQMATAIANALIQAFLQGVIKTTHAGVGVGAGVATFRAPPAGPLMVAGFKSAGLNGTFAEPLALAVGSALDTTFASLVIPVQIVGSASPTGASGTGLGQII